MVGERDTIRRNSEGCPNDSSLRDTICATVDTGLAAYSAASAFRVHLGSVLLKLNLAIDHIQV